MNLETLKIDLAKQLFNIDEKAVLEQIKLILDSKEIVAYATNGKPLNIQGYNSALEIAEQDIKKGKVISSHKLKYEIQSWKK